MISMSSLSTNILSAAEVSDLVINSLPGVFYLQEENGGFLRWNKNFEIVSEYSTEEIRKLRPTDFFEAEDHERIKNIIQKVFDEGEAEIEIAAKTKSGKKIPFHLNGKAINYEGKSCLIGMGIDISERIKAENENKNNESHLHALFDNVGGSVFLLDTQKRLVIFNNELRRVYNILSGKDPEPGELAYGFLPPDEMQMRHEVLDRVLQGNKEIIEVAYERNGEKIFFRSGFNPIIADGRVTGICCYTIDITSYKRSELDSQKNQERLNYHINNSPLALIEYDKDLRITFWSKRAKDIFGWTEKEVTGKKITEFFIHKDDARLVSENLLLNNGGHENHPISNRNYTRDGRILHCRWHNSFLTNEKGEVETIMSVVRDITDLWKAEVQKEAMATDLIKRNNDLEQFTYIVSHNLRAPIVRVIALADMLTEFELSDEEKKETIVGISQSAHKLDDTIKDLNDILRLKSNINENKEIVVFSTLVSEIEQNIRHFNKEEFAIETDFSATDSFYTIKNYLVSIFSNLISNSIKYRQPDEAPLIKIKSDLHDNELILTFKDNGIGFDLNNNSDQVFGLYKRFHFHVEGKGLGLFMVRSQVETLGGKISLTSGINSGTEFTIRFKI